MYILLNGHLIIFGHFTPVVFMPMTRCHTATRPRIVIVMQLLDACTELIMKALFSVRKGIKGHYFLRYHETPHRPHRRQIQVLGIGKMFLVWCILLILIKKRNKLRFSCISDLHFVTLAAYSV